MKEGSHQRHSYPFDKRVPKIENLYPGLRECSSKSRSLAKQETKKMHNKKQREHNRKISNI